MTVVGNGIVLGATVSAGVAVSTTSVSEPEHPANTQIKLITSSRRFMLDILSSPSSPAPLPKGEGR